MSTRIKAALNVLRVRQTIYGARLILSESLRVERHGFIANCHIEKR